MNRSPFLDPSVESDWNQRCRFCQLLDIYFVNLQRAAPAMVSFSGIVADPLTVPP